MRVTTTAKIDKKKLEKFYFSETDTAKIFSVARQTVSGWDIDPEKKKGRFAMYYLPDVVYWALDRESRDAAQLDLTQERAKLAIAQTAKTRLDAEKAQLEKDHWRLKGRLEAEIRALEKEKVSIHTEMRRLDLLKKQGILVNVDEAIAGARDAGTRFRTNLFGQPARLAVQLAAESRESEVEDILYEALGECVNEFERDLFHSLGVQDNLVEVIVQRSRAQGWFVVDAIRAAQGKKVAKHRTRAAHGCALTADEEIERNALFEGAREQALRRMGVEQ